MSQVMFKPGEKVKLSQWLSSYANLQHGFEYTVLCQYGDMVRFAGVGGFHDAYLFELSASKSKPVVKPCVYLMLDNRAYTDPFERWSVYVGDVLVVSGLYHTSSRSWAERIARTNGLKLVRGKFK